MEDGPTLQLNYPPELPPVLADPDRVEQILVNLLSNAVRHTQAGSIAIQAWPEQNHLWIAVRDTGRGIDPAELPYIFDRFWRSERSRQQTPGGTGVGLAITKRLVELQAAT